ncbi:MAG: hypothetical protein IPI28_19025 [Candidatus Omnitrophica bacterium]|nr:hypothetical protein [Candidatus Omnitrophota bacterium]
MMDLTLERIEELEKSMQEDPACVFVEKLEIDAPKLLAYAKKWVGLVENFECEEVIPDFVQRISALEAENAELVTRCNRLTALLREAVHGKLFMVDVKGIRPWMDRAKAELEGK